jgi:peptide deformylase
MNIRQYPDECLTRPSSPVSQEDAKVLADTLLAAYAELPNTKVGLAAPQIGINKRVIVVMGSPLVNPVFTGAKVFEDGIEACFSISNTKDRFKKRRNSYGWLTWNDPETFELKEEKVTQHFIARVIQHEIDHLDGKLCSEDSEPYTQPTAKYGGDVIE